MNKPFTFLLCSILMYTFVFCTAKADSEHELELEYGAADRVFVSVVKYIADRLDKISSFEDREEFMMLLSQAYEQLDRMRASKELIIRHGKDRYREFYRARDRFQRILVTIRKKGEAL